MSTLLITYDLNKPGQNYEELKKYIDKFAWARLSESSYAIETSLSPEQIYSELSGIIDSSDTVYIVTLTNPWYGQGSKEVNQWLSEHLNRVPFGTLFRA
jgi:hypothetical protein